MTLLDLGRLIRRYVVLVVALPIICVAICAGVLYLVPNLGSGGGSSSSSSYIVVNSQLQAVAGLAANQSKLAEEEFSGVTLVAKGDSATYTVTITATGEDDVLCADAANEVAERAVELAEDFFSETSEKENVVAFNAQVQYAQPGVSADDKKAGGGKMKYLLVALLAGLFVAICIVVIIDMVRRPVKSIEGVQDAVELPVLEKLPVKDGGERLLANVRFASKVENLSSVCVVPVGVVEVADETCEALIQAAEKEGLAAQRTKISADAVKAPELSGDGLSVVSCESFQQGMGAAYTAQHVDAVVLVVSQWSDSLKQLESAVAELQLADTNLVGVVFGKEGK